MPSYVIHLACAKEIVRLRGDMDAEAQNLFCIGSIAADLCRDKRDTHFWDDDTYRKLVRKPNLNLFLSEYGDFMNEPYVYGYYTHLLLDRRFLEQYWERHFRFYNACGQPEELYDAVEYAEIDRNGRMIPRRDFFSDAWYYGDYDAMNGYFAGTYSLSFPDTKLSGVQRQALTRIRELDWEYAETAMKDIGRRLMAEIRDTISVTNPSLHIFCLSELETLIEKTAKEAAGI